MIHWAFLILAFVLGWAFGHFSHGKFVGGFMAGAIGVILATLGF